MGAVQPYVPDSPEPEVVPKEKPAQQTHEAIIELKLTLPDREIVVFLTKPHVYANADKSRLTKSEIKRCVENGLAPVLGRLFDLPGGGK